MNKITTLVITNEEAVKNIINFNKEVNLWFNQNTQTPAITTLVSNIPYYRAWYCYFDDNLKKHLFAPSKYIGYKNMNAEIYHKNNSSGLDGRKTESSLANWYEIINPSHPKYNNLRNELNEFCQSFGKTPNSLFRLNIVQSKNDDAILENDITDLIWKIYQNLSNENKVVLKQRILKTK